MPQKTFRSTTDPKSEDICTAFRELAIEAGYVHRTPARAGTIDIAGLAEALQQGHSTVWTWASQYPPRVTDMPWIERALGLRRGAILARAGFIEQPDLISLINSDERITPEFKESLVLYAQAALERASDEAETARRPSLAS